MKRWYCDRCGAEIDIDHGGFVQMRVTWWSRGDGKADRMEYRPDPYHRDGNEEFMLCAKCANETFGQLEGMVGA